MSDGFSVNVRTFDADQLVIELLASAQEMRDVATVRALNKTAEQGRTAASRLVRAAGYNLKAARVKDGLRIHRASTSNMTAAVVASGRPIPLIEYSATWGGVRSKGVSVKVLKSRKMIEGAFIARMPNGHMGVFVREPGAMHRKRSKWHSLPIRELYGPSIPDALMNAKVKDAMLALIEERFPRILAHEHSWLRRKTNASAVN